jgi:hypothetical protein
MLCRQLRCCHGRRHPTNGHPRFVPNLVRLPPRHRSRGHRPPPRCAGRQLAAVGHGANLFGACCRPFRCRSFTRGAIRTCHVTHDATTPACRGGIGQRRTMSTTRSTMTTRSRTPPISMTARYPWLSFVTQRGWLPPGVCGLADRRPSPTDADPTPPHPTAPHTPPPPDAMVSPATPHPATSGPRTPTGDR